MKITDFFFLIYFIIGIVVFATLEMCVEISNDNIQKTVEIILNTSSITMGFFATVFTFIFGLKDNNIHNEIMKSTSKKRQYKFLNGCIITLGFLQIIFAFITILLLTMKTADQKSISSYLSQYVTFNVTHVFFNFVLSMTFIFFLFFGTYLLLLLNMIFQNPDKEMKEKEMPDIKKRNTN